jgi:uncharacterized phage protein (TIGR02218 family)
MSFSAEIRGLTHKLGIIRGRIFQHGCDAVLGDGRCRVDLTDRRFGGEGSVVAATAGHSFTAAGVESFEDAWFDRGTLTWLTGANQGVKAVVKSSRRTTITLWQAAAGRMAPGDRFRISAGCDKQFATCRSKFANGKNFRGFPHMPGNDALL